MGPINQKGTKCHQNLPQWAISVKKGQNAIKICLNGPHKSKGDKMPSKSTLIGAISEKGRKCHQNLL